MSKRSSLVIMSNSVWSTRTEAIEREIIPALGDYVDDFDIDGLADEVLDSDKDGYWCNVSPEQFFEIAAKYDKEY